MRHYRAGRGHMTEEERDTCLEMWRSGRTLEQLAELYDRERDTIRRLVQRRGAQKRRLGRYANRS